MAVDPVQAAKLLDDLHQRQEAEVPVAVASGDDDATAVAVQERYASGRQGFIQPSQQPRPAPKPPQQPTPPAKQNARSPRYRSAAFSSWPLPPSGTLVQAWPFRARRPGQAADETRDHEGKAETRRPAPATAGRAARDGKSAPLVLELLPDGLHIGGGLVTGGNLLPAVANLLGAPTRTNQAAPAGTVIYAYDDHGLLIYSQPGGGTNHLVLDCEATGGANGTTSPFAGTLKVEDQVIGPDTDSQTLAGIKKLGMGSPKRRRHDLGRALQQPGVGLCLPEIPAAPEPDRDRPEVTAPIGRLPLTATGTMMGGEVALTSAIVTNTAYAIEI